MFVRRNWYVAGRSRELGDRPFSRTICGDRIAFFRDAEGAARAVDAVCPHRGIDLGEGTVVEGALQCPFHGFRFAATGQCVRVPSQSADRTIARHIRVARYPVVESQGLIWIWPEADAADPETGPERYFFLEEARGTRAYHQDPMVFAASYVNTMENALDGGHLAFAHTGSLPGTPELVPQYTLDFAPGGRSFSGVPRTPRPQGDTRSRLSGGSLPRRLRALFVQAAPQTGTRFTYDLSGAVYFDNSYANGTHDQIYAFFTPVDATHSLAVGGFVRNHSRNPVADRLIRSWMDLLMNEDKAMLTYMTPAARGAGGLPRPALVRGDYTSAPFRRLYGNALRREGQTPPWLVFDRETTTAEI